MEIANPSGSQTACLRCIARCPRCLARLSCSSSRRGVTMHFAVERGSMHGCCARHRESSSTIGHLANDASPTAAPIRHRRNCSGDVLRSDRTTHLDSRGSLLFLLGHARTTSGNSMLMRITHFRPWLGSGKEVSKPRAVHPFSGGAPHDLGSDDLEFLPFNQIYTCVFFPFHCHSGTAVVLTGKGLLQACRKV